MDLSHQITEEGEHCVYCLLLLSTCIAQSIRTALPCHSVAGHFLTREPFLGASLSPYKSCIYEHDPLCPEG